MTELFEVVGLAGNIVLVVWLWRILKRTWPQTMLYRLWKRLGW